MRPSIAVVIALAPALVSAETRTVRPSDLYSLKDVSDPRVAPDGSRVAYVVTSYDEKEDAQNADLYAAPTAGGDAVRLTSHKKSDTTPRWSPDGRFLAFLSDREKKSQVYLLDMRGGEAVRLTDYKASVADVAWSPDGTRLALVVSDADPDDVEADGKADDKERKPRPIVIERLQFMRDTEGYLRELRKHLYVFDLRTKKSEQITSGPYDDSEPAWSPDGRSIAFTSNRTPDSDANFNSDIFVVDAKAGATPRAVTSDPGADASPAWSPDGRSIAYIAGGDPKDIWYATTRIAVVPATGGAFKQLTAALDRNVYTPRFTPDGRFVLFIIEDGGNKHLGRVALAGGAVERIVAGERDVQGYDVGRRGEIAVLESQPHQPAEISLVAPAGLRRVSHANDEFLTGIRLAHVERFEFKSSDGSVTIQGFLTRPPDAASGTYLPTILRIHGGPTDQFTTEFHFEWQVLAARGYAVVACNPRGSSGRGRDFAHAIWADWGHKDFEDVMGAVDHAIAAGIADPDRLGVHGWSYGGMLTDHVITKTTRFKAAMAGASEANYLADFGTDHYQREWETELGLPWKNREQWLKISPWFDIEKVKTPTLVMCGSADMNVPLLNSEQLYQALRRVGVPTTLVIYPDEYHEFQRPSFIKDRLERIGAWYDRYLLGKTQAEAR
jgi:dipeptidyl aminopeptidase/acylaminoacyl peptidase